MLNLHVANQLMKCLLDYLQPLCCVTREFARCRFWPRCSKLLSVTEVMCHWALSDFFRADGRFFLPGELPLSLDTFWGLWHLNLSVYLRSNLYYKGVIISLTTEKVIDLLHNLEQTTKTEAFDLLVDGLLAMKIIKFWHL